MTHRFRSTRMLVDCRTEVVASPRWGCRQLSVTPARSKARAASSDQPAHLPARGARRTVRHMQASTASPFPTTGSGALGYWRITNRSLAHCRAVAGDLAAPIFCIKMEPLEGDISRPIGRTYFFNLNANKRSLSVNTRTPEGKEVAQRSRPRRTFLLANLRRTPRAYGIGPDMLQKVNPRLIETH